MKTCTKCGEVKGLGEFYKRSAAKDGLGGYCKSCEAEKGKAWHEANKERRAETNKAWHEANKDRKASYREANKERLAEKNKAWREANKERLAETGKAYREANKDRIATAGREWYEANKERHAETGKAWYEANKERHAETGKAYREANKDRIATADKAYREANKDRIAVTGKAWKEANPEKVSANCRNRRARKRNSEGTHTAEDIKAIFTNQRGLCAACQIKLVKSGKNKYHTDHIMPIALGGSNWPANLQCLCPSCNLRKSAKHPDEWAKLNGKLL